MAFNPLTSLALSNERLQLLKKIDENKNKLNSSIKATLIEWINKNDPIIREKIIKYISVGYIYYPVVITDLDPTSQSIFKHNEKTMISDNGIHLLGFFLMHIQLNYPGVIIKLFSKKIKDTYSYFILFSWNPSSIKDEDLGKIYAWTNGQNVYCKFLNSIYATEL